MNILLLGSGGREHALAWKIAQSRHTGKLFIAPGNGGTALHGTNVNISPDDFKALAEFVAAENISMLVPGPEDPLVKGLVDYFRQHMPGLMVIGPSASGARLEGSKEFAKAFMERHGIPTASHRVFGVEDLDKGLEFLNASAPPYVLKADGLAAGKGVIICHDLEEARQTLHVMINERRFGKAGERVVIEQFLQGIELSVFVITDGKSWKLLPSAKDYKRIGEGDTGPNTGGMGSVSPVPFADEIFMGKVEERIIKPTIEGIRKEKLDYKGFIFFGLMNVGGNPYVIEYNVRMGDPEAESIIPRIKTDIVEIFLAVASSRLNDFLIETDPRYSAAIMMVSGGYPGAYRKGLEIRLPGNTDATIMFHAGTVRDQNDKLLTNGGRVMAITGMASTLSEALAATYKICGMIEFEDHYYRKDIGKDLVMMANPSFPGQTEAL